MSVKYHTHKVTIMEKRRSNKMASDMMRTGVPGRMLQSTFNKYYKDQVKALYGAVVRTR